MGSIHLYYHIRMAKLGPKKASDMA